MHPASISIASNATLNVRIQIVRDSEFIWFTIHLVCMTEKKVSFNTPDGLTLAGRMQGSSSTKCAILIHGFLSDMQSPLFEHVSSALQKIDIATLRFDLRGCGLSDDAPISLTQLVDVQTAIDFCLSQGYQQIILVGHSLGGLYALQAQNDAIIARIGLAAVTSSPSASWRVFSDEQKKQLLAGKDVVKEVDSGSRKRFVISSQYISQRKAINQGELLLNLSEPVLLLHGGDDHVVEPEQSIQAVPLLPAHSDLQVIRGANHWFIEHWDEVCQRLTQWLAVVE